MGQNDIAEKILADYNDVFADIVNVLLFDGRKVIAEDSLETVKDKSQYRALDGEIHEQERDVVKLAKDKGVQLALFGFEHQTKHDKDMPFRVIGYDGAAYRSQILHGAARYPVITLVLNFEMKRWDCGKSLHDVIDTREELLPYFSDYKINVFDIAFLEPEQVEKFQSDFKIVAEYFVQKRTKNDYVPRACEIRHVDEILKLMTTLTRDYRYEAQIGKVEKEGVTMCEILDKIVEQGRAEERAALIQKLKAAGMLPLDFDVKDLDDYPPEKSTLSKIKL